MENGRKAGATGPMKKQRIWPVLLAAGIGFCILCGLGVWQVKRLAWKEALIADLDKRLQEPPREVTPKLFDEKYGEFPPKLQEHTRLKAKGRFFSFEPYRMIATANGAPGWRLLHPFKADSGPILYVDRGVLPEGASFPTSSKAVEIEGIIAWHDKGHGLFDPDNDVENNRWYWWDWYQLGHDLSGKVTPDNGPVGDFALQLLPGSPGTDGLFVEAPKTGLRNNHLGYAITWFGLAAALVGVTGAFIWRSTRP
jgi:surfeit locus 1 family protein